MSESAAAQASSGDSGAQQVDSGAQQGGEQVIDYGEILAQHQSELARSGKTVEALRAELDKTHGTMDRVRKAFSGEEERQISPYQKRMQEYDDFANYLKENQVSERYPVTDKVSQKLIEMGKEAEARAERLEQELAEIKAQQKRQSNPAYQGLERAAFIMEGMVDDALTSLYGADQNSKGIRSAQFNAVTARINEEIKDLLKNDPEALLKVQRNPKIMRNMVNHFMAEMLPPKVRERMEEDRIKAEPLTSRDLMQAFAEARESYQEALSKGDERAANHYSNLITDIRRDILAEQYGSRKDSGKPTINSLIGSYAGGR